ncbi:hypothetical protein Lesp02_33150 [Lentzea sp. NBRC 105346]|uniref:hypothetical protein n=1 Tax=Lentzea sp. NBRC 105346 TaxID=3032205 RepID=UPI00249FD199|nr:hypothetical protein [Lentzea sp. NBRC 105346]GLZ31127.1 hypothetical protein Lesp02_33150 [Lentzea sp. NBRC 105346]
MSAWKPTHLIPAMPAAVGDDGGLGRLRTTTAASRFSRYVALSSRQARKRDVSAAGELISGVEHQVKNDRMFTLSSGKSGTIEIVDLREGSMWDVQRHKLAPGKS